MTASEPPSADTRFELLRPLGRGGIGQVYLARDTRLDREVAVKFLRQDNAARDRYDLMQAEARHLAQLNHANVVQIHDIIELDDKPALVMEYVAGRNLRVLLAEQDAGYAQRLLWLVEIAEGLAAAHGRDIVHCDLKAENVLISAEGVAKVADFGIATSVSDPAVDLTALGELAEELLSGCAERSPLVDHTVRQLKRRGAMDAQQAAAELRQVWLESTQVETVIPGGEANSRGRHRPAIGSLLIVGVLIAVGLGYWLWPAPAATYVAVLQPELGKTGELTGSEQLAMESTVLQALQQSVIATEQLELVGSQELAGVKGSLAEIALATGADEVVTSTIECRSRHCDVLLERRGGSDWAVLKQRRSALLVSQPLETLSVVQGQWHRLYPQGAVGPDLIGQISDEGFSQFISLYSRAQLEKLQPIQLLEEAESLVDSYPNYLPLLELYSDIAMNSYDELGDLGALTRLSARLDKALVWADRSPIYHKIKFFLAIERRDTDAASIELDKLRELGIDLGSEYMLAGRLASFRGQYEEASHYFKNALALRESGTGFYYLANNYTRWGRLVEAKEAFENSLALYAANASVINNIGLLELEFGNIDEAKRLFMRSLEIQESATTESNLGLAYMLEGDYQAAYDIFKAAYNSGARGYMLVLNLADTLSLLGDSEGAHVLYQDIVERARETPHVIGPMALSQAHAQLGNYEDAVIALENMTAQSRGTAEAAFNAALVYALAGQYVSATVEVQRALGSGFSPVWFQLPWFDELCNREKFSALLKEYGHPQRCP
jgi:serine/threonine-protein kinase